MVDKLNIDKLKTIKLINNLQLKVSKIYVNKVKIVPVELQKVTRVNGIEEKILLQLGLLIIKSRKSNKI